MNAHSELGTYMILWKYVPVLLLVRVIRIWLMEEKSPAQYPLAKGMQV
jgi:hypothetical protein